MKSKNLLIAFAIFTSLLLSRATAEDGVGKNQEKATPLDVRAILEEGQKTGRLPAGLVLIVSADLHGLAQDDIEAAKAAGKELEKSQKENFEITSNKIKRIDITREDGEDEEYEIVTTREETRPFDSQEICKALLEGKLLEIAKREGTGDPMQFVGTNFHCGGRSIELKKVDGDEVLVHLYEHCTGAGYYETDARAFAALYERLAQLARQEFKSNKTPVK